MSDPNKTTREYLAAYLESQQPPGFAVLLAAPWGTGKTHLVRALIAEQTGDKPLYVSLFGVRSREEIDAAIAQERLRGIDAGKVVRGFNIVARLIRMKGGPTFSLSLAQIGRFEAPGFRIPDTLIFDDLERTGLTPRDILGAINGFVERDGKKVILLANEEKLWGEARDEKEKVIGRTLPVVADFDAALPGLLTRCGAAKAFLEGEAATIREVFAQAGFHNLRALGQALWDFDRLYRVIALRHCEKAEGMRVLLHLFLALSLEVKAGALGREDLKRRGANNSGGTDRDLARLETAADKYDPNEVFPGFMPSVIPADLSAALICDGALDPAAITAALDATDHFRDAEQEEEWRTMHSALVRPPDKVQAAFATVERRFADRDYVVPGEMMFVFDARLKARAMGLIAGSLDEIEAECRSYIDAIAAAGRLPEADPDEWQQSDFFSYAGIGTKRGDGSGTAPEHQAFWRLHDALREAQREVRERGFAGKAERLIGILEEGRTERITRLLRGEEGDLWQRPVLALTDPARFASAIASRSGADLWRLCGALVERHPASEVPSDAALTWLSRLTDALEAKASDLEDSVHAWQIRKAVTHHLRPVIAREGPEADVVPS